MSGDRDESELGEGGPKPGSEHAEQKDCVVVANPFIRTAFSRAEGTIISLVHRETNTELVDSEEAQAEGFLWRLETRDGSGPTIATTSKDCAEFSYSFGRQRPEGSVRLWLQWRGILEGADADNSALTVQVSFPDDVPAILFDHEVELPAGHSAESLEFPCLSAVGCPDPLMDEGVFLPFSGGIYLPNPRARGGERKVWRLEYPGPASMQVLGYCRGDRTAL